MMQVITDHVAKKATEMLKIIIRLSETSRHVALGAM